MISKIVEHQHSCRSNRIELEKEKSHDKK